MVQVFEDVFSPLPFEPSWLDNVHINLSGLQRGVNTTLKHNKVTEVKNIKAWAIKALTLTDLTTLSGDDTKSNVERLCQKAAYPFTQKTLDILDKDLQCKIHTAAVCVYPNRVEDAFESLKQLNKISEISIAAVATGFPSGQFPISTRLDEIKFAIIMGATEIDVVIDRQLVLVGNWKALYDEIVKMREVCGKNAHLKTILGIGECGTMENVYKASLVAMLGGSDFIKTSTGKESVNATLPVGFLMIRAIQHFYRLTGRKVGLKPAGGVRTVQDAILWMTMIKETLGSEWLQPNLFRFGASGLLDDIEKVVLN